MAGAWAAWAIWMRDVGLLAQLVRAGELEEVVGGAEHRPFAADLAEAPLQEPPEAPGVLDLVEHRLDGVLSATMVYQYSDDEEKAP